MRLGLTLDLSGAHPSLDMARVLEAERLGFDQVWTGESYGTDAVTPAAWVLARTTRIKAGTGPGRATKVARNHHCSILGRRQILLPETEALQPIQHKVMSGLR